MVFRIVYNFLNPDDFYGSKVKAKPWKLKVEYLENDTR